MGGPGTAGRDGGENLRTAVSGSLNPSFVEWLMGYPLDWFSKVIFASGRKSRKSQESQPESKTELIS
jgi:hypothetical protein